MSKLGALIVFLICFPLSVTGLAQSAVNPVTESDLTTKANQQAAKESAIALLNEIGGLIMQIRSPETRLRIQVETAQLLMLCDEKRAGKWVGDAVGEYKQFRAAVDPDDWDYLTQYGALLQFRQDIIRILASYDADAALSFLYSTPLPPDPYSGSQSSRTSDTELELLIATEIVRKDPKRALEIGRQTLKKSYSTELVGLLSQLERQDRQMARQLADEIASKVIDQELLHQYEAASLAVSLIRSAGSSGDGANLSNPSVKGTLFTEERYRSLIQKMLSEALSFSQPYNVHAPEKYSASNMLAVLQSIGDLDKFVDGGKAKVEKKLAELRLVPPQQGPDMTEYEKIVESKPVEAALRAIEGFPEGLRLQFYIQLANKQANAGNVSRARQIIDERISIPQQRIHWLGNFERQEISEALKQGNIEEAIRKAGSLRRNTGHLADIASQIGFIRERPRAIALLEQVRNILGHSPQARDEGHLNALLAIAVAFSRHDPKRSFEIIEPLFDQFNELCAAARTLGEFGSDDYYNRGELDIYHSDSVGSIAVNFSEAMGQMALIDFERAKSLCDRVRFPEVRSRMFLALARKAIEGQAIEGGQER